MRKSKHNNLVNRTICFSDYPGSYMETFKSKAQLKTPDWPSIVYVDIKREDGITRCFFRDNAEVMQAHEDALGDSS